MINLVGTWDGFSTNSSGVTKIMLVFNKENLENSLSISQFTNDEILKMTVKPVDTETELVFDSLEFYDLKVKASGDSRLVLRTITEYLKGISFEDLNNLVDAQVEVSIEEEV